MPCDINKLSSSSVHETHICPGLWGLKRPPPPVLPGPDVGTLLDPATSGRFGTGVTCVNTYQQVAKPMTVVTNAVSSSQARTA